MCCCSWSVVPCSCARKVRVHASVVLTNYGWTLPLSNQAAPILPCCANKLHQHTLQQLETHRVAAGVDSQAQHVVLIAIRAAGQSNARLVIGDHHHL